MLRHASAKMENQLYFSTIGNKSKNITPTFIRPGFKLFHQILFSGWVGVNAYV